MDVIKVKPYLFTVCLRGFFFLLTFSSLSFTDTEREGGGGREKEREKEWDCGRENKKCVSLK